MIGHRSPGLVLAKPWRVGTHTTRSRQGPANPPPAPDAATRLRVLLVDDTPERVAVLKEALACAGCVVDGVTTPGDDLAAVVRERQPDAVIIDVDSPSRDTLESLRAINRDLPRPIIMFVERSDGSAIEEAMKAGVSAYVIDGLNAQRVKSIIDVALARFKEYQTLRSELERTKGSLQDRKIIDRAKGILMEQRKLGEDEAYRALRRLAMEQNRRLVDVAQQLITFAQVLKP
jgi:two-component system, response regulator / RNA-binding antiterminator